MLSNADSYAESLLRDDKARVLVVDDHPIVSQGLADLINLQPDLVCCAVAASFSGAQQAIAAQQPDLVLLDLRLGNADGLENIKALKALFGNVRILVVSQFEEMVYAERALRAGAAGYIMKDQATQTVVEAIRCVLAGQFYLSQRMSHLALAQMSEMETGTANIAPDLSTLTDRELHVLSAIGSGKGPKEIANDLHLSVKTVETYREHLKYKLGLASSPQLGRFALEWLQNQVPVDCLAADKGRANPPANLC